jgi:hypothetical protein
MDLKDVNKYGKELVVSGTLKMILLVFHTQAHHLHQ